MKEVNVINIDNEEYLLLDTFNINENNYFILANILNPNKVLYRKRVVIDGERYLEELEENELNMILKEISNRYKNLVDNID